MHSTHGSQDCKPPANYGLILESLGAVNVWILCNEDAGRSLSDTSLRQLIESAGHTVVRLIGKKDVASEWPGAKVDVIVAAGGDGTVKRGATLAAKTRKALAILPLGTANNIAMSLGISADVPQLIASWNDARPVAIDAGRAKAGSKEWLVLEGIGGGLMPAGIAGAEQALESVDAHPVVEVAAAVRVFYEELKRLKATHRTVIIDGTRMSRDLLMFEILNVRSVGPNLVLAPEANPSDGLFDVVFAETEHRKELLAYLGALMQGQNARISLPSYRARHVHVETSETVHVDDKRVDLSGIGGIEVSVTAGAITLLM
jgi:diacylglycerol kinase family enzyme